MVYIDEIDKLRMSGTVGKDLRLGVQHALLKMLEGTIATVPPAGGYKHPMQPEIPFNTTNAVHLRRGVRSCRRRVSNLLGSAAVASAFTSSDPHFLQIVTAQPLDQLAPLQGPIADRIDSKASSSLAAIPVDTSGNAVFPSGQIDHRFHAAHKIRPSGVGCTAQPFESESFMVLDTNEDARPLTRVSS
jgi:hypothetical protein